MSETEPLFSVLRQSADPDAVAAIERLVANAPDHALNKINALELAAKEGLDEERVIAALLHAARRARDPLPAIAGRPHDRLRSGDAFSPVHRRQGRADPRAAGPLGRL